MNEKINTLRSKSMTLPVTPGVYIMKNKQGEIIYIGKAKALKNRVSTYFGSNHNHTPKVIKMVENVDDFDYILTDTELEALILECRLIKQHSPKYNILLKDDKGYSYIKVTTDGWRKLEAVLQRDDENATYIGPYASSFAIRNSVDQARKIFQLPSCHKKFPDDIGKGRPCLNFHIKQCMAPCSGKVKKADYDEAFDSALGFLSGTGENFSDEMQRQMQEYSDNLEFEKAAKIRDRLNSIEKTKQRQKIFIDKVKRQDVFCIVQSEKQDCLAVLRFDDGWLYDSEHFLIEHSFDLAQTRCDLLLSYYTNNDNVPEKIIIDGDVNDMDLLVQFLSEKAGRKVKVLTNTIGDNQKVLEMCRSNAAQQLAHTMGREGKMTAVLDELAKLLGLSKPPVYIEAYDISHTSGSDNVAGMVVFKNGYPYKRAYKRFSIKGFSGQDDYASMAEVLERRFNHYFKEKDSGEGFGVMPDLILLDGAQGQINAVKPVLDAMNIDVPVFGMVKDSKHKTRAIASDGGEIAIKPTRKVFSLITSIQDEVHRFAITYHRKKHKSTTFESRLTSIEGIGKAKAGALIKHFKTIKAISEASVNELESVAGIGETHAKEIYKFFHTDG